MPTKEEIQHWLFRNARAAVAAELAEVRDVATSSRTTKPEVAAKVADCQHAVDKLLSPLSDDEDLVSAVDSRIRDLEEQVARLEAREMPPQPEKTKCKK